MQPQEIDKIKQLIRASSLLSSPEKRSGWRWPPIMNDKQLWELKNILSHNTEHGTRSTEHKPMGIPPLTHIMNLPKAGTAVFPKEAVSPGVRDASGGKKAQEEPKKHFGRK